MDPCTGHCCLGPNHAKMLKLENRKLACVITEQNFSYFRHMSGMASYSLYQLKIKWGLPL